MKLSERAMLTTLHRGAWGGSKHDQEVTEQTAEAHSADTKDAGRYSKQLISRKFLSKVGSKLRVARDTHRILTLPWDDEGTRILSAQGYMHYTQQMRTCRLGVEAARDSFLAEYPEYIKAAKLTLGTMFNKDDYPSVGSAQGKVFIDVEIKPIPEAGDFRTKLADGTIKAIAKDIEQRTNARIKAAVDDVFQRVYDAVGRMAKRLSTYEPSSAEDNARNTFRDSLVYNVVELADLLPSLNITDDQRLTDLAKRLKADLPSICRTYSVATSTCANKPPSKLEKLAKKVGAYLA